MISKILWFIISLMVLILSALLLITGSSLLTLSLSSDANIPLGTFITWIGIFALPLTIYLGIGKSTERTQGMEIFMNHSLKVMMILSVLWLPICYLLAGNISFTFTEKTDFQGGQLAMKLFWYFNSFLVGAPLIMLAVYAIYHILINTKQRFSK